jgi:hypothetical protein
MKKCSVCCFLPRLVVLLLLIAIATLIGIYYRDVEDKVEELMMWCAEH